MPMEGWKVPNCMEHWIDGWGTFWRREVRYRGTKDVVPFWSATTTKKKDRKKKMRKRNARYLRHGTPTVRGTLRLGKHKVTN